MTAPHLGDPFGEQRRLAAGRAVVDLSDRGVLRLSGPERLSWLHALTSQALDQLLPGERTEALLLSPTGHVEHHLRVQEDGEATWLIVEPGTSAALVDFLERMRFFTQVEIAEVSDAVAATFSVVDGVPTETLVPRTELADLLAGTAQAGMWAYEALRIARGEPRLGLDTDERTIPNEVGWIGTAVHLDKGCYRGQETVARVHTLGRPPRRLVRLWLDGSPEHLPAHGDEVWLLDGERVPLRPVGVLGSAARHYVDGPIALSVVKRNVPSQAELLVRSADGPDVLATQEVLVDPDVGLHVRPVL